MRPQAHAVLVCAAIALAACKTTAGSSGQLDREQPAVIVDATPESNAELERAVADLLSGADVTLSEDALTESSVLIIERQPVGSLANPPLSGRDLGRPERFHLLMTDGDCLLVHESTGARYALSATRCVPEE